jgi:hypothetical protein
VGIASQVLGTLSGAGTNAVLPLLLKVPRSSPTS